MAPAETARPFPSKLVTAVAWTWIALTGFSLLWQLYWRALGAKMARGFFSGLSAAFFAVTALILALAIGLLKRKNWTRKSFIALLALLNAWNLYVAYRVRTMAVSMGSLSLVIVVDLAALLLSAGTVYALSQESAVREFI